MAQQLINLGSAPNAGNGDQLISGGFKTNANFTELYGQTGNYYQLSNPSGYVGSTFVTNASGILQTQINANGVTIASLTGATGSLQTTVTSNTASIASHTASIASITAATGNYATILYVSGVSGVLQNAITTIPSAGNAVFVTGDQTIGGNKTFTGIFTSTSTNVRPGIQVTTANALGTGTIIDVTKALNTVSVSGARTFSFSATPTGDSWFSLEMTEKSGVMQAINIPSSFSVNLGATRSGFSLAASSKANLTWHYDGSVYNLYGDPVFISDLTIKNTPVAADLLQIQDSAVSGSIKGATISSLQIGAFQVTGQLPIANGGTNASTVAGAMVNLTPSSVSITGTNIDWSTAGSFYKNPLTSNTTFTFSNAVDGRSIMVAITNTGSFTATWPALSWPSGASPTQTTGAHTDVYTFLKINSTIYGNTVQNF